MQLRSGDQCFDLAGIKAIIFDLDGTLVESEPVWAAAKRHIAEREKVTISEPILLSYVGRSVSDFVIEIIKPKDSKAIENDIIDHALRLYDSNLQAITGAAELVRSFHENGFLTAICSSAPMRSIDKSVAFLGIVDCIDVKQSTENLAKGKPDKMPYVATLKRLGVAAHQTVVFEDAPAGLTAAISAEIATVCVGPDVDKSGFDCVLYANGIGEISLNALPKGSP